MPKLVELYCMNEYKGLHTLNTAKKIIWGMRGFFGLDGQLEPADRIKREDFFKLTDIEEINRHLIRGEILDIENLTQE